MFTTEISWATIFMSPTFEIIWDEDIPAILFQLRWCRNAVQEKDLEFIREINSALNSKNV